MSEVVAQPVNAAASDDSEIPEGSENILNLETSDIIMKYLEKKKVVSYQGVSRLKTILP